MKRSRVIVGVTGIHAMPDNPAPGIAVIRCLRKAFGKKVHIVGLGYDAFDSGFYISNCCDSSYLLPAPRMGLETLFYRLEEIQKIEHIDVIIPCLDSELSLFSRLSERLLAIKIKTFIPTEHQLKRISKERLPELAKMVNCNYPEVKTLYSSAFFDSCRLEGWAYPLVVKGIFYDARIINSSQAGVAAFDEIAKDWGLPIIVQRFVKGEEFNLCAIGDGKGNMIGEVMMKKVAVTHKNKAYVGVSIYDRELHAIAEGIIKELQWKGPFELEMMRDSCGVYHLIEMNPRFPSWILLSAGVDRNLPAILLELAQGKKSGKLSPISTGTYFIRYAHDEIVSLKQAESVINHGFLHLEGEY